MAEENTSFFGANGLESVTADSRHRLAGLIHMNAGFIEAAARCGTEWADFTRRRLERDMEMSRKLAACRDVPEAIDVFQKFYQTAFSDYSSEFGTFWKNSADIASDAMSRVVRETGAMANREGPKTGKSS
ncbi:phasin family protein [Jiella marina]|uniref:phasin family protein n=1 Tax=Jiella sp. LLJ827 TaxID=2917712 RepID=UPI002101A419|nr:phasin family protein [Jiella sp. LLJ827]MCQ0989354.1 phasin family protein [Jiella sp. LLJ827]